MKATAGIGLRYTFVAISQGSVRTCLFNVLGKDISKHVSSVCIQQGTTTDDTKPELSLHFLFNTVQTIGLRYLEE